jgi:hypothetical protein
MPEQAVSLETRPARWNWSDGDPFDASVFPYSESYHCGLPPRTEQPDNHPH